MQHGRRRSAGSAGPGCSGRGAASISSASGVDMNARVMRSSASCCQSASGWPSSSGRTRCRQAPADRYGQVSQALASKAQARQLRDPVSGASPGTAGLCQLTRLTTPAWAP